MRHIAFLTLSLLLMVSTSCSTSKDTSSAKTGTETTILSKGTIAATVDGKAWKAETTDIERLGKLMVIKGTDAEGRNLSFTLPFELETKTYDLVKDGEATVTWSVSRAEGWNFKAPYSKGKDGTITITANTESTIKGSFNATVSNSGREIVISGTFEVEK